MTVKELKKELSKYSDKTLVVLSKDSEGNAFKPLQQVCGEYAFKDGELLNPDDAEYGFGEAAICLWPKH